VARVARVLPDEPALDKEFDYLVPEPMAPAVRPGTMVRAPLHGRRVGGWVLDGDVSPPPGVELRPLAKVRGWGPPPELLDLARWAAWRWAGRRASLLRTASPERAVVQLPRPQAPATPTRAPRGELAGAALDAGRAVLRLAPAADRYDVVLAAVARGNALVLVPSVAAADALARRLRRDGVGVARHPQDWARARAGATVVGTRSAAWAPVADLAAVVVLDEHDEVWQQEQAPTWHARDVVVERAARAGVPCVLVSPTPSLEALAWAPVLAPARADERAGWPLVEVVDRRDDEPGRGGLFSPALVRLLRSGARVACVLNRKGRARLVACHRCGEVARCERCEAAVVQSEPGRLACVRCGQERPTLCLACGGTKVKGLRPGVSRVREELEALVRAPVVEVTAETAGHDLAAAQVYVGTEAVLHQLRDLDAVAFLDLDQELLAPRYRAAEEAMALLVRAARLVGPRARGGRVLVQTRLSDHEVVQAVLHADPTLASRAELARRQLLRFPPVTALAAVSGAGAEAFMAALGHPAGVEVAGPADGQWLLRAGEQAVLLDALAATPRPGGRLRVAVDPLRL
jgi:primosomal protein N' (replication factor Y)